MAYFSYDLYLLYFHDLILYRRLFLSCLTVLQRTGIIASLSSCFRFCPIITHESVWTTLNLTLYYIATSPYLIFTFYIKIPQWYFQSSYRKWRLEIEKLENWTSTQYLPSVVLYNHVQIYNSFTACRKLKFSERLDDVASPTKDWHK